MNVSYAATLSAHFVLANRLRTAYRNFHGSAGALCAWRSPGQFLMVDTTGYNALVSDLRVTKGHLGKTTWDVSIW